MAWCRWMVTDIVRVVVGAKMLPVLMLLLLTLLMLLVANL